MSPKPKIKDDNTFEIVNNLLKLPWILGGTKDFLLSIKHSYEKVGELTKKQIEAVKKIETKNSSETIEKYNDWAANYEKGKKETAKICANYYRNNPPYFSDLSDKILNDSEFIPSERQYIALCEK